MAIFIGRRPDAAFTRVPNEWARDPKLSTKAKGLLLYLLSHQDGYQLTVQQAIAENADGRDSIYKTLGELVECGYLRRDQRRGERGKVGEVDYYVADAPQVTAASGFTASGESGSGDDQGKQDVSAGETASWNTGSGSAVSGKPDTKKTRVKKTNDLEDQKTTSPNPSTPGSALEVVDAEIVEAEDGSTSSTNPNTETLVGEILAIRPNWKAHEIRTHVAAVRSMLDDNDEAVAHVARETAKDPNSARPSRITASGNPHLQRAKTTLMVIAAESAPPPPLHPEAHAFELKEDSSSDCKHCPFPKANGRHRVGNQGGGYIGRTPTAAHNQKHQTFKNPPIEAYHGEL